MLLKRLTHSIFLILSFCFVIVGSDHFGAPFTYFIYWGLFRLHLFAMIGVVGILITLGSLFSRRLHNIFLLTGNLLFIMSLLIYLILGDFKAAYSFYHVIPLLTLIIFLLITGLTLWKQRLDKQ